MTSLAESSIGSVPVPQIETLRQHMLMHTHADPVASEQNATESRTEQPQGQDAPSEPSTHVEVPASGTSIIPQSQDVSQEPHPSPLRLRPPNLVPSASAPVQGMESVLDLTPSQNAFRMLTKAASFHAYPDGDTQPMESQVYRDFNESMVQPPGDSVPGEVAGTAGQVPSSYNASVMSRSLRTCEEGDTGYIDLEGAFQPASPSSTGGFDELLASPQTQAQMTVNGKQHGSFVMPETPAFAGQKHGRDGEVLTSATTATKKTPTYSQLFGMAANGSVLSATQLFNQTQAPSSPLPDHLRSDPVITRPSPNINGQGVVSSPPDAFSSPILPAGARSSSLADPKGTYTSMRESQERRAAHLRQELGRRAKGDEDLWLDESVDDPTRSHWQQRRMRRVMSDHAVMDVGKSSARVRLSSRPSSANNMPSTISIMETPAALQHGERLEFDDEYLENESEEELDHDDGEADYEEPNDNDEYDELAQILRSQANEGDGVDDADPKLQNQAMQHEDDLSNEMTELEAPVQRHSINRPSTQQSAIADSQPGTQERQKYKPINHNGYHSSSASFVPGSQYAGRTSEDQARFAASQYTRNSTRIVDDKIPSSPPLPTDTGLVEKSPSGTSEVHVLRIEQATTASTSVKSTANAELEVPESDLPEIPYSRVYASASQGKGNGLLFSTAQTHATNHTASLTKVGHDATSPLKAFASQHSRVSDLSPRKIAGVRRFSEFASITPPDGTGQTEADVEAVMNDVMTTEDREYIVAISDTPESNTRKRRKLVHNASASSALSSDIAEDPSQIERSTNNKKMRAGSIKAGALGTSMSALNSRRDPSPDSVRTREKAGAQAVSQLVSGRTDRVSRRSKANTWSKVTYNPGPTEASTSKHPATDDNEREASDAEGLSDHENPRELEHEERSVHLNATNVKGGTETVPGRQPQVENPYSEPRISCPERTFALFKGRYNQYFPATWIAFSRDKPTHRVQFDDQTTTDIETQNICALDLRIGDTVKVDLANMRKESWVIVGFGAVTTSMDVRTSGVDIRGRSHVLVQAKSARNSAGGDTATAISDGVSVHEVLVTNVYITHTMWKHFSDRTFNPPAGVGANALRAETPSRRPQTPKLITPGSRTRRSAQSNAQGSHARNSHQRDGPPAPPLSVVPGGVFKGMAFAVSYSPEDAERKRANTALLIRQNGGVVFDNSFLDLFEVPDADDKAEHPRTAPVPQGAEGDVSTLKIRPEFADLGFVALISDQHHRKAKYIQALALGLPTLSVRWITDCLDVGKNPSIITSKATPLGWGKYLLPAGESSYLHGAVRSRTLIPEDTTWAKFSTTVSSRSRLLSNQGVVILSGKNKNTRENRDMFAFLALALGARRVRRAVNLKETRALLKQEIDQWGWVFVDGEVTEAAVELFDNYAHGNTAGGKKRKRGQESAKSGANMFATNGKVMVVNDEFVIQSLILGALVD